MCVFVRLGVRSVGSGVGYNLASSIALHCLSLESAESTDLDVHQLIVQTHTHKQQGPNRSFYYNSYQIPKETMCPNHG